MNNNSIQITYSRGIQRGAESDDQEQLHRTTNRAGLKVDLGDKQECKPWQKINRLGKRDLCFVRHFSHNDQSN